MMALQPMDPTNRLDPSAIPNVDLPSTLEETWWVLDSESGMDDLWEQAGESLQEMVKSLENAGDKIFSFQSLRDGDRLFLGRFEFPKYEENFEFSQAIFADVEARGFIDFLAGFPIDCIEMLVAIGQYSSEAEKLEVSPGENKATAGVPQKFFVWPDPDKVLLNLTAIATKNVAKALAPNLEGEDKPTRAHWWFRVLLTGDTKKFPVPGEFLGLGVRMMPDKPWGKQKSSPFIFSGNWMDTVYYTSGMIVEVIEPTDDMPYPTYKVQWRAGAGADDKGVVEEARPSDFATYEVGDRVTILKDVAAEKKTQLWKDDDMKKYSDTWMIAPITFYGLESE